MNGFIKKSALVLGCTGLLASVQACHCYRNVVDPCYPERYWHAARAEVNAAMAPQMANGHILDQTLWNWHFEPGAARLTPGGMAHLAYLSRRRPHADPMVYLQTAHDIAYDPANPTRYIELRSQLDSQRIQAIQAYLAAETAGRHVAFQVTVHDPAEVGMSAIPANLAVLRMYGAANGTLGLGAAGAGAGTGANTVTISSTTGPGGVAASTTTTAAPVAP